MRKIFQDAHAFTLAEVLITLLIIGIVASLVIPNIIQDAQDAELKTAWKKTYSDFSQLAARLTMDNGGTLEGVLNSDYELYNQFKNYMNFTKYCFYGTSYGNCWHNAYEYKYLSGTKIDIVNGTGYMQSNGNLILLLDRSTNCVSGSNSHCLAFIVDINGFKGPNTFGKDIYGIFVYKNSVKPWGYDTYQNTCDTSHNGYSCAMQYLYQ
jgi:prepilin-type N-terminal cleavage/methylation domain-containing protein